MALDWTLRPLSQPRRSSEVRATSVWVDFLFLSYRICQSFPAPLSMIVLLVAFSLPAPPRRVLIYDKYSEADLDMKRFDRQFLPSFSLCIRDVRPYRSVLIDNCILIVSRTGETRYLLFILPSWAMT